MYKTVQGRWGTTTFFAKDEYVGKSMYHYGEYNPDETEMIISLAVPGKMCLDIGANIGCISQALLKSGFKVAAFEPQPEVAKVLVSNMMASSKDGGFSVHNVALGSDFGTALMPKVHYSERNNVGGLGIGTPSRYGSYEVPVEPLDSYNFENVGFIKIDVEGYELEVLKGAKELIAREKPVLYIEDDRYEKSRALREYIYSLGYDIVEHKPTLYREVNFFDCKRNVWDRNYASHNIICKPCS